MTDDERDEQVPALTKAKLAEQINARIGLTKRESADLVDAALDLIKEALLEGEKVKISNFGNFSVRDKSARRGRNPQTGEAIIISRRRVLTFKPSARLREDINADRQ